MLGISRALVSWLDIAKLRRMDGMTSFTTDQRKADMDRVNLLSIFHFVGAGLAIFALLFLGLHFSIMHLVFSDPKLFAGQNVPFNPAQFFEVFQFFYLIMGIWFVVSCVLNVISGICLRRRTNRTFSMVVAGIDCLYFPFGTILGVFTIIILLRDSVRTLYESPDA